jgi:hypothetical protein
MADIADNAETAIPGAARAARGSQAKRRASPASAETAVTESTPAPAAQPAQRLAQAGEPPRDENTLDLFQDDPQHALAQVLETDVRQSSLNEPEQPEAAKAEVEPAGVQGGKVAEAAEPGEAIQVAPVAARAASRRVVRAKGVAAAQSQPDGEGEGQVKPELEHETALASDRSGAAALADTVATLHRAIADQHRTTTDLSRRMRWLLAGVTGALLVMVVAGVAQTVVLARLASDASAQQQRIAQMMQDQQTALADTLARLAAQPAAPAPASEPAAANAASHPASSHHTPHAATHAHRVHPASH